MVSSRFIEILSKYQQPDNNGIPSSPPIARFAEDLMVKFHYLYTPTLPHLLALLLHPPSSFPPSDTSVIVVDTVSPLFATAFPKGYDNYDNNNPATKKNEASQWAASRRWAVMGDFVSRLGKLATIRNLAIVLISQTTTKIKGERVAVLRPTMSTKSWDEGIGTRIVLYRDWMQSSSGSGQKDRMQAVRFAAVERLAGASYDGLRTPTTFRIETVLVRCKIVNCHMLISSGWSPSH